MTDLDLTMLRKVAEQATPGPWAMWNPSDGESHITIGSKVAWRSVVSASGFTDDEPIPHWADARHIATFDPATVLALLDRLETAEATIQRVREVHGMDDYGTCENCSDREGWAVPHPCDTIKALDGAE